MVRFQFTLDNQTLLGEVLFFALIDVNESILPIAVLSQYGQPNQELLDASSKTYWTAQHLRENGIRVVDIKKLISVVMMAPDKQYAKTHNDGTGNDRWYLMQKPGLLLSQHIGMQEADEEN